MKLFYVILGCIGLGLGAVGAAVPLLPAAPERLVPEYQAVQE